jgi:hypothetical protein
MSPDKTATETAATVGSGNIYLPREICEAYLNGVASIALLARAEGVLIVPLVKDSAGGLLLNIRTAHGDRVIHAQEFFRRHGFEESFERRLVTLRWSEESAALIISDLPRGGL